MSASEVRSPRSSFERVAWAILVGASLVIPIIGDPRGADVFRETKLAVLRASGLLVLGLAGVYALLASRQLPRLRWKTPDVLLTLAFCAWSVITLLTSTYPLVSLYTVITILAAAALFLAARATAPSRRIAWAYVPLAGSVINAIFLTLQVTNVWNPLKPAGAPRMAPSERIVYSHSALLGNPNDVGVVLLTAFVLAVSLAFVDRHKLRRIGAIFAALVILTGIVLSRNMTSIAAMLVALVVLAFLIDARKAFAAAVVVVIAGFIGYQQYDQLRWRIEIARTAFLERRFDDFLSGRLTAFISAAMMFKDHPITGVGPGAFAPNYLPYKICVEQKYAKIVTRAAGTNFGETHNDHLQTLAETGLPGYAMMLGGLALLAVPSFRRKRSSLTPERELARVLGLPLAASLAVLAIAQFPLHLAAALIKYVYMGALIRAWGSDESD